MILGIGTDIVSVLRMEKAYARFGERLASRLLSDSERKTGGPITAALLAKRFAAKEALLKALKLGLSAGLSFQDISIMHDARGAPVIEVSGETAKCCTAKGVAHIHLTIADETHYAVGFVILES